MKMQIRNVKKLQLQFVRRTITDYLKACRNIRLETEKMQMLAETMVAALRKGNEGCFTSGNNPLKRDCPKKAEKKIYIKIKNLQKSVLDAIEKYIGLKIVSLNLTLKKNLFQKTPSRGPRRSPSTKTRGKLHLLPHILNIWQCCHQYTSFVFR